MDVVSFNYKDMVFMRTMMFYSLLGVQFNYVSLLNLYIWKIHSVRILYDNRKTYIDVSYNELHYSFFKYVQRNGKKFQ